MSKLDALRLDEIYHHRVWGGRNLATLYGKDIPEDKPTAEAWLVSDHPVDVSVVAEGPHAGRTLHDLLEDHAEALLGRRARPNVHGRFPLLLKVLDANDVLSIQVHPDDEIAARLNEPDVGKTEMWHVLHAVPHSELICGLYPSVTAESFEGVMNDEAVVDLMVRFEVEEGTSVFVPAGTVHAIGAGIVLAEIQQNSDLTYRLYDWGRVGSDGKPRELHLDKAMEAIRFGSTHTGPNRPLAYEEDGVSRSVLAACRYFAAELLEIPEACTRRTGGDTFHILLVRNGDLTVTTDGSEHRLAPGQALLIPGDVAEFRIQGPGSVLDYYVPDLRKDIAEPLKAHGYNKEEILRLGGDPTQSDLRGAV